jgi:predicted transcriptional regulator
MRAVSSWTRNKQRLHVCAACHYGIRWLEALAQFSLLDKRARKNEGILQAINLPKCDVEKGVAEIGPLGLVLATERRMVGIGRGDYEYVGVREAGIKIPE